MDQIFNLPFKINDYTLIEMIGKGSFSTVYKATYKLEKQFYAVKVVSKENLLHKDDQIRMQRELDSCAYLKHENIVSLLEFFSDDFRFFLIFEYCEGGDLLNFIHNNQRLTENQAALIFSQIIAAISYCHSRGVVHRDLKPQNILITKFPNIKITDFGLCGYIIPDNKMSTFCGSPYYSAPECLKHQEYDGKLSDIWSLGVILYELVTNDHPWNYNNTSLMIKQISKAQFTLPRDLSPFCQDLIKSILIVNPLDRILIEQIISHPWMKIISKKKNFERSSLPPLYEKTIPFISNSLNRDFIQLDHGIASPFINNYNSDSLEIKKSFNIKHKRSNSKPSMFFNNFDNFHPNITSVLIPKKRITFK